jgi:hypothetical protein
MWDWNATSYDYDATGDIAARFGQDFQTAVGLMLQSCGLVFENDNNQVKICIAGTPSTGFFDQGDEGEEEDEDDE